MSQALAASPEGTVMGPVVEVRIVKIIDEHGIEIAIPSIARLANPIYVVISRDTECFVNGIHDHKEELRSSDEMFTSERGFNCSKETRAPNSIKETCASPPSNLVSDALFKKTVIPRGERKWITIHANPSTRKGLLTQVSKMITTMVRQHDQDERE